MACYWVGAHVSTQLMSVRLLKGIADLTGRYLMRLLLDLLQEYVSWRKPVVWGGRCVADIIVLLDGIGQVSPSFNSPCHATEAFSHASGAVQRLCWRRQAHYEAEV
jgi:hypothetical protein